MYKQTTQALVHVFFLTVPIDSLRYTPEYVLQAIAADSIVTSNAIDVDARVMLFGCLRHNGSLGASWCLFLNVTAGWGKHRLGVNVKTLVWCTHWK